MNKFEKNNDGIISDMDNIVLNDCHNMTLTNCKTILIDEFCTGIKLIKCKDITDLTNQPKKYTGCKNMSISGMNDVTLIGCEDMVLENCAVSSIDKDCKNIKQINCK